MSEEYKSEITGVHLSVVLEFIKNKNIQKLFEETL